MMFEGWSSGVGTPNVVDMKGEVIDFGQRHVYTNKLLVKLSRAPL
jgi:hypothetical protein